METFADHYPQVHHRFCVRHLYANYRDAGHKGKELKDYLWLTATAYTEREHKAIMERLEKKYKDAHDYLKKIEPELWCRYTFSSGCRTDLLVNNLCESFNAYILEAREKPIIQMIEDIRTKLMERYNKKKEGIQKHGFRICSKIRNKLEKMKMLITECRPVYAGNGIYQIHCSSKKLTVNLIDWTCGCNRWQVTGIPCQHAIAAIYDAK